MMYCTQFVEAFVRDRESQLLAAAKDPRARRAARLTRSDRGARRSEADTTARQLAEGEGRAPADEPCCAPTAA
jgi:hypothetical protein